jgi:YggT family protein
LPVLCLILQLATLLLFARIILEWSPVSSDHPVSRVRYTLRLITEPLLAPMRRLIPPLRTGAVALDLTPLIVILALSILTSRVC